MLYSGLNHVNYLNIIKRNHVSATVRTRLHLASDHVTATVQLRGSPNASGLQAHNRFL